MSLAPSPPRAHPGSVDPQHLAVPRAAGASRALALHLLVVVAYSLPAVVLWWHAWDGHLASTLACACGDSGQEVWFVAWPAYALAHGLDPLISYSLQAPSGVNLLDNASGLPIGLALAPVTWVAGPIVSTNVALTLCPALSAWATWLTCRRLVSWGPAAVVAGLLYGYSPFVVTNLELGHASLCLLVVPPLLVLCARELLWGDPARRTRWGVAAGCLLALQFFVSGEMLAIVVVGGAPAALVAVVVAARAGRAHLRDLLRPLAGGAAALAALVAYPASVALLGPDHLVGPVWPGASVTGSALSALWSATAAAGPADAALLRLGGYLGAQGPPPAYLGGVILALAGASVVVARRRPAVWALLAAAGWSIWCSLSAIALVGPGDVSGAWTPWRVLGTWPLLDDVIPQRFGAVVDLSAALIIAVGLDRCRTCTQRRHPLAQRRHPPPTADAGATASPRRPAALGGALLAGSAVAIASLWWTYQVPLVTSRVTVPRWYRAAATTVPPGSVVLAYPFPFPADGASSPMVWQAVDAMRFRLAGGYVKAPGPGGRPLGDDPTATIEGVLARLTAGAAGPLPRGTRAEVASLRSAIRRWRVRDVVVTPRGRDPSIAVAMFTAALGAPPRRADGALVWVVAASRSLPAQPGATATSVERRHQSMADSSSARSKSGQ